MAEGFQIDPIARGAQLAEVRSTKAVRSAAAMFLLKQTGTTMDAGPEALVRWHVEAVAEEFYVSEEEMRTVLRSIEPTLLLDSEQI